MAAIKFTHFPLADKDTPWDGPAEIAKASVDDLKIICAWVEDGEEDKKQAYKLPHHEADTHKTVLKGVIAAGNALMGSRGGITGIPKNEIDDVKAHLEKHYHEFGMKAPWEKKSEQFASFTTKNNSMSVKDVDANSRTVTGYFASFNTLDSDGDVFMPGAFAKSLTENKDRILHLLQHNPNLPLGRPDVLKEDPHGLYFETTFPNQPEGGYIEDTLQLYQDGVYNEHSVGFQLITSMPGTSSGQNCNMIKEAKLWEGSTVTWGANPNTPFTGMKQLEGAILRKSMLEKLLRNGNYSDSIYMQLQLEITSLKTLIDSAAKAQGIKDLAANADEPKPLQEEELASALSTIKF